MNANDTTSAVLLDRLRRQSTDPSRRVLFTGATIVTMDPELGTVHGDLLVEGDTIAAIGPNLTADGAVVVDASGTLLAPGLVDTHRHAWEAQLRRIMPDVDDLGGYPRPRAQHALDVRRVGAAGAPGVLGRPPRQCNWPLSWVSWRTRGSRHPATTPRPW
ncbi:hypothetical protein ACFWOB_01060 [Streptomyces sp. NPDC058420]|uniref:hypothetical protein n=1 Tax=Streptomyces sp. NPDC058420 TaxID=3346489 RepID=UPI0036493778